MPGLQTEQILQSVQVGMSASKMHRKDDGSWVLVKRGIVAAVYPDYVQIRWNTRGKWLECFHPHDIGQVLRIDGIGKGRER